MGKKERSGKRKRDEEESDEEQEMDPELQAELNALMSIRAEQAASDGITLDADAVPRMLNNKEGLARAIETMGTDQLPFVESMQISHFDLSIEDENDDLARELAFYNHSLAAVKFGLAKLEEAGVPTLRPSDYFCEQMKSDAHMIKIKDNLILEEKKMEAFEQRKNREMNKKFNKQLQVQKKEEKKQKEKDEISTFKRFRSGAGENGAQLEEALNQSAGKSSKRKAMDKKYGFGGKNSLARKLDDRKSLNDMSQYNPKGGQLVRRGEQPRGPRAGGRGGGARGRGGGAGGRGGGRGGGDDRRSPGGRGGAGGGRGAGGAKAGGRGGGKRLGKDARMARRAEKRG